MTPPRHLVAVWNPGYASDAMDAHINLLVGRARDHRGGRLSGEDEVHVWWGRIASPRRKEPLPHLADVLELDDQLRAHVPTCLYLTDYRSLHVADLSEVTVDDPRGRGGAVPDYYRELECDLWFGIWDIRQVVADDTRAVIQELGKLRNTRYHDHPVSLYGGMTELPLIVWRDAEVDWFGDRAELTEGRLWAERDGELRGEVARLGADLRDNLFGPTIWMRMEPATRTFLASAEAVVRARRSDPAFNFAGPALEYAKAVEMEANAVLRALMLRAYRGASARVAITRTDGRPLDFREPLRHLTLGELVRLLVDDDVVRRGLQSVAPQHVSYLTDEYSLPSRLKRVQAVRNPAAHSAPIDRETLLKLRAQLMGIGQTGVLLELARVKGEWGS